MNAGGVIQVEDERHGFSFARAQSKASGIFDVALRVFQTADKEGVPPSVAADRLAEERMTSVGRLADHPPAALKSVPADPPLRSPRPTHPRGRDVYPRRSVS